MGWPGPIDYNEALQHPGRVFADPDLRRGRVEANRRGLPSVRAGGFALVYKLTLGAAATAVRVFLYPSDERERRYRVVHDHLARHRPSGLVDFGYQPRGIRVGGDWYPVQTMPWVEGVTLATWMHEAATRGQVARLRQMAARWAGLIDDLRASRIAHGDLQHGNVLVVDGDAPVLVDYDGMCVPGLVGRPSLEVGLPAYQHPGRRQQALSMRLDDFSAWVIFLALRAVAADTALWRRFVVEPDNENLLFRESDIASPGPSPLWEALASSPDRRVRAWSARLRASIDQPFDRIPPFLPDAPEPSATRDHPADAPRPTDRPRTPSPAASRPAAVRPDPARRDALERLRRVPTAATLANDRAFLDLWRSLRPAPGADLDPAPAPEDDGPNRRGAEVAGRLNLHRSLLAAIDAANRSQGPERAILDIAGALPTGYDPGLQARIDLARARLSAATARPPSPAVDRVAGLVESLRTGDHEGFLARVDLAVLRGAPDAFRPYRRVIEGWIRAHVLRDRPIRPTLDRPRLDGPTLTIRATWAKPHLVASALVAVDEGEGDEPSRPIAVRRLPFDRFRRDGGLVVPVPSGWPRLAATITPVVDLGWTEMRGAPLRLGPYALAAIGPGSASAPERSP